MRLICIVALLSWPSLYLLSLPCLPPSRVTKDHLDSKENQVFQVFLDLMALLVLLGHLETEANRVDRERLAGMVTLEVQV